MGLNLRPDRDIKVQKIKSGRVPTLVVRPAKRPATDVAVLWIHGGGYSTGMKETLQYIENLRAAGVETEVDVYHMDSHAFDMLRPKEETSKLAIKRFEEKFEEAMEKYMNSERQ